MALRASSTTSVGLLKRFWNEKPEIAGSSFMALIGTFMLGVAIQRYYTNDQDNRRYREHYTVIRHDDPRAARLRKDYLAN